VINDYVFSVASMSTKATLLPIGRIAYVASVASRSKAPFSPFDKEIRVNRHFSLFLSLL
jgi:hypothetical protein